MIYIKSIIFLSFLFYFGCNSNGQEPEPKIPTVSLSVSPLNISVGQNAMLDISVTRVQDLYAISFEILYDHSIIEIDLAAGVISYNQFKDDDFGPVIYSNNGILSFVLGGNSIDGEIFSVAVMGLQMGTTNIKLNKVNLIKEDGTDVPNYSLLKLEDITLVISSSP